MNPVILQPEDVTVVGRITKPHGFKGSVKIQFERSGAENIETEWVMLMIDQKPVPFFIVSSQKGDSSWIVDFEDIETVEQATPLKNISVAFPTKLLPEQEKSEAEKVVNFEVVDVYGNALGHVVEALDHGYQELILVRDKSGKSFMVPFVDPIVVEIHSEKKQLVVSLPEGLIEIN